MYKVIVLILIVLIIIIIGNIYITREGFFNSPNSPDQCQTETDGDDDECTFDEEDNDKNCNLIEDKENNNSFYVHNVCPKDPRCLGVCINDHTWTDANKRVLNYTNAETGALKNPKFSYLISSSRCGECIKNFYWITKLIRDNNQCNL